MTEEELVSAFKAGQLSRRVFIRRLIQGGISVTAAFAFADSLAAPAGAIGGPKATSSPKGPIGIDLSPLQRRDTQIDDNDDHHHNHEHEDHDHDHDHDHGFS